MEEFVFIIYKENKLDIFILILFIILGIGLLIVGANLFVDGASGLAKKIGVSDFVIGMTIVALGTSAPELAVAFSSLITGAGDVLMGNVIGSNIFNLLLILGITALICKVPVNKNMLIIELPFLIIISALFLIFGVIGGQFYSHIEGVILFMLFLAYLGYMAYIMLQDKKKEKADKLTGEGLKVEEKKEIAKTGLAGLYERAQKHAIWLFVFAVVGVTGIIFGADFIVNNVNELSTKIDNPNAQKILSVLVVAIGTSLPELVTSVTAAIKGNTDIAIGNVVGSNIMNLLLVGGLPMMIFSLTYTASYLIDMFIMIGAAVLLLLCLFINKGKGLNKISGVILLLACLSYVGVLIVI